MGYPLHVVGNGRGGQDTSLGERMRARKDGVQGGELSVSERKKQSGDGELGTCHVCGATFPTQEELADHLREGHEGQDLGDATR